MTALIVGVIVLVIGASLLYFGRRTQSKTNLMQAVGTSNAADMGKLLPGEMAEIKGTIRCANPLTAEYAEKPCVWYSAQVTREYEHREKDSNGNWQTNRRSESVSSNTQRTSFFVQDSTGQIEVHLDGAEIDAPTILDRFEDKSSNNPGININIGGASISNSNDDKTLGYRYNVKALAVDTPIYVLGVYREDGTIGAPPPENKARKFIVSYRSEEELHASWKKQAFWLGSVAIVLALAGVVLIVIGIITMIF
jgi:hypothetical protein